MYPGTAPETGFCSALDWSWLNSRMLSYMKTNFALFAVADNATFVGANVSGIDSLTGSDLVANYVGRFQRRAVGKTTEIYSPDGQATTKALTAATAGLLTVIAIASPPVLPASASQYVVSTPNDAEALAVSGGASTWFASPSSRYIDGTLSNAISAGVHAYETTRATTFGATIHVGGSASAGGQFNYLGGIVAIIGFTSQLTAPLRAAINADIKRTRTFYGI